MRRKRDGSLRTLLCRIYFPIHLQEITRGLVRKLHEVGKFVMLSLNSHTEVRLDEEVH